MYVISQKYMYWHIVFCKCRGNRQVAIKGQGWGFFLAHDVFKKIHIEYGIKKHPHTILGAFINYENDIICLGNALKIHVILSN